MSHPELEFFNSLSGTLEIELTAPTEQIGNLENVRATPDAKIKSLKLVAEVFNRDSNRRHFANSPHRNFNQSPSKAPRLLYAAKAAAT